MKNIKSLLPRAAIILLIFTIICGVLYTGIVTGVSQVFFPKQANGSIIEVDGKKYGCELLGQQYNDKKHMWGRIMNIDVSTYKNENGEKVMYAQPSNLSPTSDTFKNLVSERVTMIKEANPQMEETNIPVDLVTCSGSGLDPHISPAAAEYQIGRLEKNSGLTKDEINTIIKKCSNGRFLGLFGEETINVLKVNLMIDGILK